MADDLKAGTVCVVVILLTGTAIAAQQGARGTVSQYSVRTQPLPGAAASAVSMDYIAFDPATRSVWVPAGNSGAVDVIDSRTGAVRQLPGFPTAEMGRGNRKRIVGPSSVTVGKGSVYVGNRADFSVCAFDARTLARGTCHRLDSMPDGLAFSSPTREVWVTTPKDKSVRILDAVTLEEKAKLAFDGNPEGFAVDPKRGRFYTNLEDNDRTLAIDLATRKTVATWNPSCGADGPHGLRVDANAGHLFVACSTRAEVLDIAHEGAVLSSIDTGGGVDDLDYSPATHLLYIGAARAGQLTIARAADDGKLSLVATVATPVGARNPAVTDSGAVYLAHAPWGDVRDLVVVEPPPPSEQRPELREAADRNEALREMKKRGVLLKFDPCEHRAEVNSELWRSLPPEQRIRNAEILIRLCGDPHGSERLTIVDSQSGLVIGTIAPAQGRD